MHCLTTCCTGQPICVTYQEQLLETHYVQWLVVGFTQWGAVCHERFSSINLNTIPHKIRHSGGSDHEQLVIIVFPYLFIMQLRMGLKTITNRSGFPTRYVSRSPIPISYIGYNRCSHRFYTTASRDVMRSTNRLALRVSTNHIL